MLPPSMRATALMAFTGKGSSSLLRYYMPDRWGVWLGPPLITIEW